MSTWLPQPAALLAQSVLAMEFTCGTSILLVLVAVATVVWLWWRPRQPGAGRQLVDELDHGPAEWSDVVSTPYQRELAYRFKAEFGELRYNNANRIIAGEWVRKAMAENKDLRLADRVWLAPVTEQLCLLPTRAAVFASALASDPDVIGRRAMHSAPK
nr:MAG: hypothetical protein [Sanya tombus-like virus 5]